jgi:hypothetical protein
LYSLKIKVQRDNAGYAFSSLSYGEFGAATRSDMRVQFYIGENVFITIEAPWKQTPTGWKAPKDH